MANRCWVQPVGQPRCPSVTQPKRVSLVGDYSGVCVCTGAQQQLREKWSAEQSADVFTVGANHSL